MKTCKVCGDDKPLSDFKGNGRSSDGRDHKCLACRRPDSRKRWRTRRRHGQAERFCTYCSHWHAIEDFGKDRHQSDGISVYCLHCNRMKHLAKRVFDPDYRKKQYQRNRKTELATVHRSIARRNDASGSFTARELRKLYRQYDHVCLACGRSEPEIQLTPDHVIPLSRGGSNEISNIQPLCLECNLSKATKTIDYREMVEGV